MTTNQPPAPRSPWYRSPWPMLILAVAAAVGLVVGLVLRFAVDPQPDETVVVDLRQFALIFGMSAFIISGYATTTKALETPALGRALTRKVFPGIDERPPPVTTAAERWAPISRRLAMFAWGGAAIWYIVALIGWLISRVS